MVALLCFLLMVTSTLCGALPGDFSWRTAKNSPEISLEYPESNPFAKVKVEEHPSYTYYHYCDLIGKTVALGKGEHTPEQAVVHVFDPRNNLIGTIVRKGRSAPQSTYEVFDGRHNLIASGSMNLLGTRLQFYKSSDWQETVIFYRPYFQLIGDYWYTKVAKRDGIDERLIIMIGAVQVRATSNNGSILGG